MLTHTARLANDVAELRAGALIYMPTSMPFVNASQTVDAQVCAFLPEPDRRERLHGEAEALLDQFPDPTNRPPLFGAAGGYQGHLSR